MHDRIFRKAVLQLLIGIANYMLTNNRSSLLNLTAALGYAVQALEDDK